MERAEKTKSMKYSPLREVTEKKMKLGSPMPLRPVPPPVTSGQFCSTRLKNRANPMVRMAK